MVLLRYRMALLIFPVFMLILSTNTLRCSFQLRCGSKQTPRYLNSSHCLSFSLPIMICINNPNLTKSLQSLSHRRLVADLSIFYRYFHGNCFLEIRKIIPNPVQHVRTTRSSTQSHPFQVMLPDPQTLARKHPSFQELLNYRNPCLPMSSPNPTICLVSNLTSTNLI